LNVSTIKISTEKLRKGNVRMPEKYLGSDGTSSGNVLLSIVVPAYNVERYIEDCLSSLVNQTMQNHKIIIVNDGSTDDTEKICLKYAKKYPEIITYIFQENKGLGEARNVGLSRVDTPFVGFLDSDDWLNLKYVECFVKLLETVDEIPDMIFTLPWVYDSVTKRILPWKDKERYNQIFKVENGQSFIQVNARQNPELYALEVTACRKIYKTSFLKENKFAFPRGLKWEDVIGHFYLLYHANTCMALPEVGFFYRINQGGQITAGGGASRLDMIPIFKELLEVANKYSFDRTEKSYVIRLIVDFSIWSVEATNKKYIQPLLEGLHEIFQLFNQEEIKYYLDICSPNKEREYGFIACLAGKDYLELEDYEERDRIITQNYISCTSCNTAKRSLLQGGIQCVKEHGICYTFVWCIKKYLLKKR
jgi:glycosyltransferase involved in cell wall biosynthesis